MLLQRTVGIALRIRASGLREIITLSGKYVLDSSHSKQTTQHIFGANAVNAVLSSNKRSVERLFLYGKESYRSQIVARSKRRDIEIVEVENKGVLNNLSGNRPHNGFVLECAPLPEVSISALGSESQDYLPIIDNDNPMDETEHTLEVSHRHGRPQCYIMLDEVTDPQNIGSIIRTAYFLGASGLILSKKNCASISPVVVKAASGATEFLPIYHIQSSTAFMRSSKRKGWSFVAAMNQSSKNLKHCDLSSLRELAQKHSICLVLGSEGMGIRTLVKNECAYSTSIEAASGVHDTVDSLNVGCATAILISTIMNKTI